MAFRVGGSCQGESAPLPPFRADIGLRFPLPPAPLVRSAPLQSSAS